MASKPTVPSFGQPTIHSQLISNQIWEAVSMMAKAAFLFLLTPVMLRHWGQSGYGAFAVASSMVVFVSMFDLGLRGRARVELCHAVALGEMEKASQVLAIAMARFGVIAVLVLLLVTGLETMGICSRLLDLPPESGHLILLTAAFTQLQMLTGFLLEPLIAEGRIGLAKLAGAAGAAVSVPAVWLVLHGGGGVAPAIAVWLGCLTMANLLTVILTGHFRDVFRWKWSAVLHAGWGATFSAGLWFNVTNAAWLAKGHGLTFLISAISGPATAGTFFIILRLSEIIGTFGAISCDVTLGGMAGGDIARRRSVFSLGYSYATILCLVLAAGIGFLTPAFWILWLNAAAPVGWATGWLAALLGLASGLNRIIVYAAMALGIVRAAAIWTLLEAGFAMLGVMLVQRSAGLGATLLLTSLASLVLVPVALQISRALDQPFWTTWQPRLHLPR
ncbi:MAG: hypothetical protein ABIT76_07000 [Chthoniobacterales bacterium]